MTQHQLLSCAALLLLANPLQAALTGWRGMRVIHQEGRPAVLQPADIDGDGCDELIVVNTQHSRLDLYRWIPPEKRAALGIADDSRPNDLPMPYDFRREEIPLEHLPYAVASADLDKDGKLELIILVAPPNKILVYGQDESEQWHQRRAFNLLAGSFAPRVQPLLVRQEADRATELLVGMTNGIQQLDLTPGAQPSWLSPRERQGRANWWLADIDGDGDQDLVEHAVESDRSVRWFQRANSGHLMPGQILFDRAIKDVEVLRIPEAADHVLLLDGASKGLLRRYGLVSGEESSMGNRYPLALKGGEKAIWCGLQLDTTPALVAVDRERPQLLVHRLEQGGWDAQQAYPMISDIKAIAAAQARPGTLLIWAEDAAEIYTSRWEAGRMSFPSPWQQYSGSEEHHVVALSAVGSTTWWLLQVGSDCDLYVWGPGDEEPRRTRFEGINLKKGGQVQWLGGQRLLVRRDYRDPPKLVEHLDGKTVTNTATHLKQIKMEDLQLLDVAGEIRVARRGDGVLQWLSDELRPVDQIMLPQGRQMSSYIGSSRTRGWALEQGGRNLHVLEANDVGIPQIKESVRIRGGVALASDPVLGLMLLDNDRVVRLERGQPWELKMINSIDGRIDRRSGIKQATIHRIRCLDVDGDATCEVLLMDDRRHQLSVLSTDDGQLTPEISWPVFEDNIYPYSDDEDSPTVAEPRAVVALDIDGDTRRDLAMACHDRIILYLANDEP